MDVNFTLLYIIAYVGGRRRLEYWRTTHAKAKVGVQKIELQNTTVNRALYTISNTMEKKHHLYDLFKKWFDHRLKLKLSRRKIILAII